MFREISIVDKASAIKYIKCSTEYLEKNARPLPWDYPPLPVGWVWKGYYTRNLNSPVLNYFGKVAIRLAYVKSQKRHHAFIPGFIIPWHGITIFDLEIFLKAFFFSFTIGYAVEKYSDSSPKEHFDLPVSTAYFRLAWFIRKCRTWLGMATATNSIQELRSFSIEAVDKFILDLHARAPP